jgi:glucose/arabinose dehydrogenase
MRVLRLTMGAIVARMACLNQGSSALALLCILSLFSFACSSGSDTAAAVDADGGTTAPPNGKGNEDGDGSPPRSVDADAGAVRTPRATVAPTVRREPVLALSDVVWDLAFLPDGAALVTMRSGEIRKIAAGALTSTVVANAASVSNPLAGLFAEGQSGLMGIAVDSAFAQNRRIYVYFSHDQGGTKDNRVVRYRLTPEDTLADRKDLVTGISYKAVATSNGGPGSHSGGRLRFGPDGFLYLTTGDNQSATIPQDVEALGSKVLRFTTDGAPAPGNPTLGSRKLVWALGFRNPQGIAFHPWTGDVFISEHGPGEDDEVTKLKAGANGGWNPNAGGTYNGYSGAKMTDTTAVPTATAPIWKRNDSNGMSACTFLRGESWKAWRDRLAVAFLNGKSIVVIDFDATLSSVVEETTFPGITERVRSVVMGPDERLWVTSDEGRVFRYVAE